MLTLTALLRSSVTPWLLCGLLLGASTRAAAQAVIQPPNVPSRSYPLVTPPSGGTDPGSSGVVMIIPNPSGPDTLSATFRMLTPKTCYALFMTSSVVSGSTPGSLVGQFCTDKQGKGQFFAITEVMGAFVFYNMALDADGDGRVEGQGAGVLANGGFQIPTPIIRVYRANAGTVPTVFSGFAGQPGGLHTLSSPPIQ